MQIVDGYLSEAMQFVSNNKDDRPDSEISLIVIHCISLPEGQYGNTFVQQLFCNTLDCSAHNEFRDLMDLRVSSHLFIRRDGSILQFVPFSDRAWHAGESSYGGRENCNDYSIGIELEGTDRNPFEEAQYKSLSKVCHLLCESYDIRDIVGHSDIAPNRKTDPGSAFDWSRVSLAQRVCNKEPSAGLP